MKFDRVRQRFIGYYVEQGFDLLPRTPLLHPSIPMSFVMSAGLVQVETSLAQVRKKVGNKFVLVQECFRHFDLEKVGTDDIHLSFFEMPGAFVFASNDKMETIQRMWTLATSVLGISKDRIWASYFNGGEVLGEYLPPDETTRQAWIKAGLPKDRVVGLGASDNYWVQGKGIDGMDGPRKAGPNTELFYDRGIDKACGPDCKPGCKCGRFIEFANSLFICYELESDRGPLRPMAEPFVETVIGSERVAMILQNAQTVFEIDLFKPVIEVIEGFIHTNDLPDSLITSSKYVIADHIRALCFLVADGAPPPGKNGRERIVKKLIRGVLTRQIILGIESNEFLPAIIEQVYQTAGDSLQRTCDGKERLLSYFSMDTPRFFKTVERGRHQLLRFLEQNGGQTLSGSQIVYLEKRCGLPSLLTAMMLREKGLPFAEEEYKRALEVWKQANV